MQLEIICKDLWGLVEALLQSLSYQRIRKKRKSVKKFNKKAETRKLHVKMKKMTLINTKAKKPTMHSFFPFFSF